MKNINNFDLIDKKVVLRADLNVPVINGKITEYSRIRAIQPTITKLIKNNNKVFIISHFGRPKGKTNDKFSLKFICPHLEKIFGIYKILFLKNIN